MYEAATVRGELPQLVGIRGSTGSNGFERGERLAGGAIRQDRVLLINKSRCWSPRFAAGSAMEQILWIQWIRASRPAVAVSDAAHVAAFGELRERQQRDTDLTDYTD